MDVSLSSGFRACFMLSCGLLCTLIVFVFKVLSCYIVETKLWLEFLFHLYCCSQWLCPFPPLFCDLVFVAR
jgi:hypothetical protein